MKRYCCFTYYKNDRTATPWIEIGIPCEHFPSEWMNGALYIGCSRVHIYTEKEPRYTNPERAYLRGKLLSTDLLPSK